VPGLRAMLSMASHVSVGGVLPLGATHMPDSSTIAPGVAQSNNEPHAVEPALIAAVQLATALANALIFCSASQFAGGAYVVQLFAPSRDAAGSPLLGFTNNAAVATALGNPGVLPPISSPLAKPFKA
jgi:hypothetical protein